LPNFDEAARARKNLRVTIPENPDNLTAESMMELEKQVQASLVNGYLPCPIAWKIAWETGVTRKAVGEVADRLGIRVSDCQIGFFSKLKTPNFETGYQLPDERVTDVLKQLDQNEALTCEKVFLIARQYELKPLDISRKAGAIGIKIRDCQLGCF
jgi:hypothetical protein